MGLAPIRPWGRSRDLGRTPPAEASPRQPSPPDSGIGLPRSILTGVDAPQEPPHPGPGGEPAADRRRGGRRERRGQPEPRPRLSGPSWRWCSGFAVALTILVNVIMLQRRFRPLERLVDEMERADLSRPGANLRRAVDGRRRARGGRAAPAAPSAACSSASRPSGDAPRAPRSPRRRRSARGSPATFTTRSTSR